MGGIQRVQDAALQVQAAGAGIVILDLVADAIFQGGQVGHADLFRQRVVNGDVVRRLDLFHGHGEHRVFAGQFGGVIIGGERHLYVHLVTGLGADELFFKAGNELARAQGQVGVFALAAFERHAGNAAFIVNHNRVVFAGLLAFGAVGIAARLLGDAVQRLVHFAVGNIGRQAFDRQLGNIGGGEIGHQIHRDGELEVGLAIDHVLHIAHRVDARLDGGLEIVFADRLLAALVHCGLDHFAHHRLAILLLQEGDRRLAGTKALEIDPALHLFQLFGDAGVEFAGGNRDRELAAQVFGNRLGNLHGNVLTYICEGLDPRASPGKPGAAAFFKEFLAFRLADLPVSPARRNRPQHWAIPLDS